MTRPSIWWYIYYYLVYVGRLIFNFGFLICGKNRKMSSGAVFQLISNDGKADKMILATDLLE
jgi:hypothetical protein